MDNFMIENWLARKYIFQVTYMYYTVHDTSLQYAVTYNTVQVVVYPKTIVIWGY